MTMNQGAAHQPILLGVGGQGRVYKVQVNGKEMALKRYHKHLYSDEKQLNRLKELVNRGQPSIHFIWPTRIEEQTNTEGYGYYMPLREARFRPFSDFLARRIVLSFKSLTNAGSQIVDAFFALQSNGFCYRDISTANIFLDPTNGDVRIIDNDNVATEGTIESGVVGTINFMAPELVLGNVAPSQSTDLHSLAVVLFYLFMGGHPLEGKLEAQIRCKDLPAHIKLYGKEPIYIFDPSNLSNRPVPGLHVNPIAFEPLYPLELRKVFTQAFTEGLKNPNKRPRFSQWRSAFQVLKNTLKSCPCGAEYFQGVRSNCWSCGAAI